jgi:hypothetical protein
MTTNVTKITTSRPGNGTPDDVANGTDSASTSDTAPRNPAHPTKKTFCHGGYGAFRSANRRLM